ncbi:MAG: hypothetical protein QOI76_1426 [Frankiales bacterium]|jgi:hypothetical protein|nr:hypothetical protein [Frankiales bacterium]
MIVRVMGEGQLRVADTEIDGLNALDNELQLALEAGDEAVYLQALTALTDRVRKVGRPVSDDELVPSDIVIPTPEVSLDEVRQLAGDEGLIPG